MARRANGSNVSYKELDSDGDSDPAPCGLSDHDDEITDADLKALKAAAPLAKKRKKAGTKRVGDTYGARRPPRKIPKRDKDCESDASHKEPEAAANGPKAAGDLEGAGSGGDGGDCGELLLRLPFEMFAEICSYFELRDLVRFAKSSKKLHKILLARDARSIWSCCRERMGYSLPQDMTEIQFALFIAGESCQHCRSASSDDNELQFTWMVRFCYNCTRFSQFAPRMSLGRRVGRLHPSTLSCVRVLPDPSDLRDDTFLVSEVIEVNSTLVRLRALDDAARAALVKRSLWTTRSRGTEFDKKSLRTDNVSRYLSERKAFVDRFEKESDRLIADHDSVQRHQRAEMAQIAAEKRRQLQNRINETAQQLRDSHGWTSEDTAELQYNMLAAPSGRYPDSLVPKVLPNDDRNAWTTFRVTLRTMTEMEEKQARQRQLRLSRERLLEQTYATMTRSLKVELLFVPSWNTLRREGPVSTFLWAEHTAGEDETPPDSEELCPMLLSAAKQHVQRERLAAIRGIVAAHLGISQNQLSKDEHDYPTDVYDDAFFRKIPNRFAVTSGRPRTFRHLAKRNNDDFWRLDIHPKLPQWRRATRHILLAAGKEASCDLDEVNALGASFAWVNGPESTKDQRYTWKRMVKTIIKRGPRGLRLSDLKNINITYTPDKGKGKGKALGTTDNESARRKIIVEDSEDDGCSDGSEWVSL